MHQNSPQRVKAVSFLGTTSNLASFWRQEYIVAPLKGSREAMENDDLRTLRVKRMELPIGDLVFPLAAPEDQGGEPPKLDDQECIFTSRDHKAATRNTLTVVMPCTLGPEWHRLGSRARKA